MEEFFTLDNVSTEMFSSMSILNYFHSFFSQNDSSVLVELSSSLEGT